METLTDWQPLARASGELLAALLTGYLLHRILWRLIHRLAERTSTVLDDSLARHCRRPTVFVFPVLAVYLCLPFVSQRLGAGGVVFVSNVLIVLLTFSVAWTLIRLTAVAQDVIAERYDVDASDNLAARAIHTQFSILRKIAVVAIGVLALGLVLMGFDEFRQLGTGILASAGLVGLVVGFAAQKTLANLLAGIQLAVTQPIRMDDVVIVEGEWGRIEEITLTYVVVRIWDLRRLVLPISYFLEQPFQNWTRVSADILGTVFLYVDYTVPVEAIRAELERIVQGSANWDGEVCGVQVTDTSTQGIEVRALVSAADASKAWDLRCEVREKLVAFLQREYPDALPKLRGELRHLPDRPSSTP
ncbi:MAG: mechanosensitive ion channel [Deltaproteobacteria bacterium]|nr:mechanosensitive ion channel [Deltaproteobacteria bacterium]MBW2419516.1 mechanosensitive ion channel [Deltaproteobacteria bacterium]